MEESTGVEQEQKEVIPYEEKEEIFIAVPSVTATVSIGILNFLLQLERASMSKESPFKFSYFVVNGKRPVEYARNVLIGVFLEQTKASRLWFIDEDMLPTESSHELLQVNADIVAGRMYAFDHSKPGKPAGMKMCAFYYNKQKDHKFNPLVPKLGDDLIQPVDGMGTASMLIRRKVLEDRRMWLDGDFKYFDKQVYDCTDPKGDIPGADDEYAPPIFRTQYKPNGRILRGEDLDFCFRAKQLGYTMAVHLGAKFGHHKPVNLDEVSDLCQTVATRVEERVRNESRVEG